MQATDHIQSSGFYSAAALAQGGRLAAVKALDELMDDLEILIIHCDQKILELNHVIKDRENGIFPGRPPSQIESTLALSVLLEDMNYLRQLRLSCMHNLGACKARRRQLRS